MVQPACSQSSAIFPSRVWIQAEGPKLPQICSPSLFKEHSKMPPSLSFPLHRLRGAKHPVSLMHMEPPRRTPLDSPALQGLLHGGTQETCSCSRWRQQPAFLFGSRYTAGNFALFKVPLLPSYLPSFLPPSLPHRLESAAGFHAAHAQPLAALHSSCWRERAFLFG